MKHNSLIEFLAGDLLASIVVWIHFDITTLAMKLGITIILGFIGGLVSMLAKDIYTWLKEKYWL